MSEDRYPLETEYERFERKRGAQLVRKYAPHKRAANDECVRQLRAELDRRASAVDAPIFNDERRIAC